MARIILIKINKDDNNVDEKVDNCFEINYWFASHLVSSSHFRRELR